MAICGGLLAVCGRFLVVFSHLLDVCGRLGSFVLVCAHLWSFSVLLTTVLKCYQLVFATCPYKEYIVNES